jgi:hypothetical protein
MLNVDMLSVIMLSVIMLIVFMLHVVAPRELLRIYLVTLSTLTKRILIKIFLHKLSRNIKRNRSWQEHLEKKGISIEIALTRYLWPVL